MAAGIDYFYTHISPWAYLGHRTLLDITRKHGATLHYRPFAIMKVWGESGGVPLGQRHPARQRYRMVELQRWRDFRGVELTLEPAHFPTDPGLADRCAIALVQAKADPATFSLSAFKACWAEDKDIAEQTVIAAALDAAGHDAAAILEAAAGDAVARELESNTKAAIASDSIGSPAYVLNGESFWGQDRLELLDAALTSGRGPYRP